MSNFSDFFIENVESAVKEKEIKHDRFKSPIRIRAITTEEQQECFKEANRRVRVKKKLYRTEYDHIKYLNLVTVKGIVTPDLFNADLQDNWNVNGAENLLLKMFTPGEIGNIRNEIMKLSGLADNEDEEEEETDLVEEAKN